MSIVALHKFDENNFMHFFVVKEFTEDGNVIGKFLTPDREKFLYMFDQEYQTLPINHFENGFDLSYEGEMIGGIDYQSMPSVIVPNPLMTRKFQ